jgi:type I restriction enzyme R subunit
MIDFRKMTEKYSSQLRAVFQLAKMGWLPISRAEVRNCRDGNKKAVILEPIVRESLIRMNKIEYKGKLYDFSKEAISNAIFTLTNQQNVGAIKTNQKISEYLLSGIAIKQIIEGDIKSFQMKFIDFVNPENNVYNVAWEVDFETVSSASRANVRLDIVLYINGIPVAEIENKDGAIDVESACEQLCGYQQKDTIAYFYHFMQIMAATNRHHFLYGTVGTAKKHYAKWREKIFTDSEILSTWKKPLLTTYLDEIFDECFTEFKNVADEFITGNITIQEQDRGIFSLFSRARFLDLIKNFIIFDSEEKKICRYQQFFAVKNIETRISNITPKGNREGGLIWHTQGSGKSLTMVMSASMILNNKKIKNPQIIIVTDRTDLDEQIKDTFTKCGLNKYGLLIQAKSGQHLIDILSDNRTQIITTLIQKFSNAINGRYSNLSPNVFILIDESHRTQNGINHFQMKKTFPNGCYIGFTGTPLMKKEKNTINQFGGLIDKYTIDQAIEDAAVVRLLYEGRHVEQEVYKNIDKWFERDCEKLTNEEKAKLKKKFANKNELHKVEEYIKLIAHDISKHFQQMWQGTSFKAQLVTPSKYAAILYKKYFDEMNEVKTEVVISAPDLREGNDSAEENIFDDIKSEVKRFWNNQMNKYGTKNYPGEIIKKFKSESNEVEIIIVVDKLLTGFDVPRNRVLYITRNLEGHTLLQAIARVNRTFEGKQEGYIIDYANILENLDKAITQYSSFAEYDEDDLKGVLFSVRNEIEKLPKIMQEIKEFFPNLDIYKDKLEDFENCLTNQENRIGENGFYKKVSQLSKILSIALSNEEFNIKTDQEIIEQYRQEFRFFWKLRESLKGKYAESDKVQYKEYEDKIKDLLNKHVAANEVLQVIGDVDIFNEESLSRALNERNSDKGKADLILNNTKKSIEIKLKERDPALFKKFSKMIEDVLEDVRSKRLSDLDYLLKVKEVKDIVVNSKDDSIPEEIVNQQQIHPFYRKLSEYFIDKQKLIEVARFVYQIIHSKIIVDWKANISLQNEIKNAIDDYLYDVIKLDKQDIINQICDDMIDLAKSNFEYEK